MNKSKKGQEQIALGETKHLFFFLLETSFAEKSVFVLEVSLDAHVHRVGRTGRAGQRGHAYSLLEPEDRTMLRFEE